MNNHTPLPHFKQCKNGDKCLHPDGPHLPITEFYRHPATRDGYLNQCKVCQRERVKQYSPQNAKPNIIETLAVQRLNAAGIIAAPGRVLRDYNYTDVVAWGCIPIEVKSSEVVDGKCEFKVASATTKDIRGDFVMLVPLKDGQPESWHVFPKWHPVFMKHGQYKSGLSYDRQTLLRRNALPGTILSPALMAQYENAWHLINTRRDEISEQLRLYGEIRESALFREFSQQI